MEVIITGHTRGIGLALANKFQSLGYSIKGYSISQGCDIGNAEHRNQIIKDSHDASIFINNAFHPTGQAELLKEFNIAYPDKNIINISSKGSLLDVSLIKNPELQVYIASKQYLNSIANHLMLNNTKILNVLPGLVDTDMVRMFPVPKLQPDYVADVVVEQFEKSNIQQFIIDIPNANWNIPYQL